jgi:hypothetical protein
MKSAFLIGALSLLLLMGAQSAFAVSPQLTVQTDKTSYAPGATVYIHGIDTYPPGFFTCLMINVYWQGELVGWGYVTKAQCVNGAYTGSIVLPQFPGNYILTVRSNGGAASASFTVSNG